MSRLRKKTIYKDLNNEQIVSVASGIAEPLKESLEQTKPGVYSKLVSEIENTTDSLKRDSLQNKLEMELNSQDSIASVIRKVQRFWKRYSARLGLDYYTNYRDVRGK